MNPYIVINAALQLVSLGLTVQEVQARVAKLEADGVQGSALSLALLEMRDKAIADAQADIDKA